jgi:HAE1 family hydrophobic/amphiphilic exporter-1
MPQPPTNWVSQITKFFLHRRAIAIVLFMFLLAGGLLALSGLRREGFPQVPVKIVVISTVYKGASAAEVEQSVTNPIESAIKDVREIKSIASTSAESHSSVIATLNENANVDSGLQNVTSKISSVALPTQADKPEVVHPSFLVLPEVHHSIRCLIKVGPSKERSSKSKALKMSRWHLQSQIE